MKFFLPKQPIFFEYFSQLNENIKEITVIFSQFAAEFKDFELFAKKAEEIEHNGDSATHKIIDVLNKTFITPFDREDIYLLAHDMDNVIDLIDKAIQTCYIYDIKAKKNGVDEFVNLAAQASIFLDELIKESFAKQKHTEKINDLIVSIHELEDQGDVLYQKCLHDLFQQEPDPILVIKWKDIYEDLEDIMDKFQLLSDTIQGIVVKAS